MAQNISSRATTLAIVKKAAPTGALVAPTTGDQFIKVQPDLLLTPSFNPVPNPELTTDIMPGKSTVASGAHTGVMSHLLQGSGVAGQKPNYGTFLESYFGRVRTWTGAEATALANSTTDQIKVSTADATKFKRGDAVLVQHSTLVWEVSPIAQVNTDSLDLAYRLKSPPAAGTKLGKPVTYYPASTELPVFDCFEYLADGVAGLETETDCRVTSISISASAQNNAQATFNWNAVDYALNDPAQASSTEFKIEAGTDTFIMSDTTGVAVDETVTLDHADYTPGGLAQELQTKVRAAGTQSPKTFENVTVAYNATERAFVFTPEATQKITIAWSETNSDDSLARMLGFYPKVDAVADAVGDAIQSPAVVKPKYSWQSSVSKSYSTADPVLVQGHRWYIGRNVSENVCVDASTVDFTLDTPKGTLPSVCEEGGVRGYSDQERNFSMSGTIYMEPNDLRYYPEFRKQETVSFAFIGGRKSVGGSFIKGETYCFYCSSAVIQSIVPSAVEDAKSWDITLQAFGAPGGSVFLTFL